MTENLHRRPHRRHPLQLQLTSMIDVFSIVVIFLILGAVSNTSEILLPSGFSMAKSVSKESVETAPRVLITRDHIEAPSIAEPVPISVFRAQGDLAVRNSLRVRIKDSLAKVKSARILNVVSDEGVPYEVVFNVSRLFREAGYESLLFVALGEGEKK